MSRLSKKKKVILSILSVLVIGACVITILSINRRESSNTPIENKYEVTFLSDDESLLKVDYVEENRSAKPPNSPQLSYGNVFIGWDTDISKIVANTTVRPIVRDIASMKNTFALPGLYGQKDNVTYGQLSLCGNVNICGFEMTIEYDSNKLSLSDITDEDNGLIVNSEKSGIIYINYASTDNTTGDVDLCVLGFKPISVSGNTEIKISVTKAYEIANEDTLVKTDVNTISSVFTILP